MNEMSDDFIEGYMSWFEDYFPLNRYIEIGEGRFGKRRFKKFMEGSDDYNLLKYKGTRIKPNPPSS